jgi:hypothetical protein
VGTLFGAHELSIAANSCTSLAVSNVDVDVDVDVDFDVDLGL